MNKKLYIATKYSFSKLLTEEPDLAILSNKISDAIKSEANACMPQDEETITVYEVSFKPIKRLKYRAVLEEL